VVPLVTPIKFKTFLSGSHRLFASYAMVVGRHFFFWMRETRNFVCVVICDRMTLMISINPFYTGKGAYFFDSHVGQPVY